MADYGFQRFKAAFPDQDIWDAMCSNVPLQFQPGLEQYVECGTPPILEWFKGLWRSTSTLDEPIWAVYAILMWTEEVKPRLYIGSGQFPFPIEPPSSQIDSF